MQDISFGWGGGISRFIEPKRHFVKPLELSPTDRDRPRALHPLLPLRALLPGGLRGLPAGAARARRALVRLDVRRAPLRGAVQRQHHRAVPGRRADVALLPLPRAPLGHRGCRHRLHALPGAVQRHADRPRRARAARALARERRGRRRLAVRPRPLRLPGAVGRAEAGARAEGLVAVEAEAAVAAGAGVALDSGAATSTTATLTDNGGGNGNGNGGGEPLRLHDELAAPASACACASRCCATAASCARCTWERALAEAQRGTETRGRADGRDRRRRGDQRGGLPAGAADARGARLAAPRLAPRRRARAGAAARRSRDPRLQAKVSDLEFAHAVLVLDCDPIRDAPILDLRLRKGVRRHGMKLERCVRRGPRRCARRPSGSRRRGEELVILWGERFIAGPDGRRARASAARPRRGAVARRDRRRRAARSSGDRQRARAARGRRAAERRRRASASAERRRAATRAAIADGAGRRRAERAVSAAGRSAERRRPVRRAPSTGDGGARLGARRSSARARWSRTRRCSPRASRARERDLPGRAPMRRRRGRSRIPTVASSACAKRSRKPAPRARAGR